MGIKSLPQCPAYHMHLVSVTKWRFKGLARCPETWKLTKSNGWKEGLVKKDPNEREGSDFPSNLIS